MAYIVIQAPNETAMRNALGDLGLDNDERDQQGNATGRKHRFFGGHVRHEGEKHGGYFIVYHGQVLDKSLATGSTKDAFGNTVPTYDYLPGVYCSINWNTGSPESPHWQATQGRGVGAYWRSDNTDGPDGTPAPLPEWFPRIG